MMKALLVLALLSTGQACLAQLSSGNSLAIPGSGQYVNVPDHTSTILSPNMTVEAWVYYCCSNGANTASIVTKGWCGSTWGFYFAVQDNDLEWVWQRVGTGPNCTSVAGYHTTSNVIPYNTWTHVAAVHTATGVSLYVNGLPVPGTLYQGAYGNISTSTEPLRIGGYRNAAGAFVAPMIGRLDDLRIWNTARTAADILSSYTSELAGSESGLVAYYKLNETGIGAGIPVANSASATAASYAGTTVGGSVSFQSTTTTPVCYTGAPPASCGAVLPIMLESFTARPENGEVALEWSVGNAERLQSFVVERSEDGEHFSNAASVPHAPGTRYYHHIDKPSARGKIYYRLACTEMSGSVSYSRVQAVDLQGSALLQATPNPASSVLHVAVPSGRAYHYAILGADGRVVLKGTVQAEERSISVSSLPIGVYLLSLLGNDGQKLQQRVVVSR